MDYKELEKIVDRQIKICKDALLIKNKEYARGGDALSNFKKAGRMKGETPEKALLGMWVKHLVSVFDIIHDLDDNHLPSDSLLDEKIKDTVNYPMLLKGLIIERKNRNAK